jgi:maltokinase
VIHRRGLSGLLARHLAEQRWFGSGRSGPARVSIESQEVLLDGWPGLVRLVVTAEHGRYHLLLGLRPVGERGPEQVGETAAVGEVATDAGRAFCYDALVDPELAQVLLSIVAPAADAPGSRALTSEQSNTSLVFDERLILKVFRRLVGANPDVEVTVALAKAGFDYVADVVGVWQVAGDDCAIAQRFLTGGAEGWALAQTSLRDLYGGELAPEDAGGDFAPEASRLGALTAELHEAMAGAFGTEPADPAAWATMLQARTETVRHPDLDSGGVSTVLKGLATVADAGLAIRVHGDYHLGQVLRTDEGWFVFDFEGEPLRPGEERRLRTSPLRDVAGMIRSFHYAAQVASLEHGGHSVARLADAWEQRNRAAFLSGYRSGLKGADLVPSDPAAFAAVLGAYELDKAVYELSYEIAHRPDWVGIPLAGARRVLERAR